uniref:Uncharacterized protein n=1 Tax=Glossina brevipalpis TaxID=37001 RepID=A0A1A9W665_9MUSC
MLFWLHSSLYLAICLSLASTQSLDNNGKTNVIMKGLGAETVTSADTVNPNARTFGSFGGGGGGGGGLLGGSLIGRLVGALFRPTGGEANYYRPPLPYPGYPSYGAYPPPYGGYQGYQGYPGYGPGPFYADSCVCKRSERCKRPFLRCNEFVIVCISGGVGVVPVGVRGLVAFKGEGFRKLQGFTINAIPRK